MIDTPKVYLYPGNDMEVISDAEAAEFEIDITSLSLASIKDCTSLVDRLGDDYAYLGEIQTTEGIFMFDFDLQIYREMVI